MHRTTIMLPPDLKARALRRARELGISLGQLIRDSLTASLKQPDKKRAARDPLFADDAVHEDPGPCDLAEDHDAYLYGEKS